MDAGIIANKIIDAGIDASTAVIAATDAVGVVDRLNAITDFAHNNMVLVGIIGYLAIAISEWWLPRTKMFKGNSHIEMLANGAKKLLLNKIPGLDKVINTLATKEVEETKPVETPSDPEKTPPPDAGFARVGLLMVLAASGLFVLGLSSCSWTGAQVKDTAVDVLKTCGAPAVQDAAQSFLPAVTQIITGGAVNYQAQLDALIPIGGKAIFCAVEQLIGRLMHASGPTNKEALERAQKYLQVNKVS